MRYEDLEEALKRQPVWEPPAGFARAVVARAALSDLRPAAVHRPAAFDFLGAAQLAAASAACAYGSAWMLWRVTPLLTDTLVSNATPVAWTCATVSLLSAMWFTREKRGWI